jgi:hypothetical protein
MDRYRIVIGIVGNQPGQDNDDASLPKEYAFK